MQIYLIFFLEGYYFLDIQCSGLSQNFTEIQADVLSVNLNENGSTAYSSGVDPTIMHFQLIR